MDHDLATLPLRWETYQAAWEIYNAQNEPAELARVERLHGFNLRDAVDAIQRDLAFKPRIGDGLPPDENTF